MDQPDVLDLRSGKRIGFTKLSKPLSDVASPLDLRITRNTFQPDKTTISKIDCYEDFVRREIRPSVITPNQQFTHNTLNQRSRWNHRSHPSIDSDSSFESEQEYDSGLWHCTKRGDAIDATRCSSTDSLGHRESMSSNERTDSVQTDTENDSEATDSSSTLSLGFYKELPELTANVSIDQDKSNSMILELSSCQAEIINPEDVHSELRSNILKVSFSKSDEENYEINENCLQIRQTETYIEELLCMQTEQSNDTGKMTSSISAGIQETASKFIKEIRKTREDMSSSGLNLKVDGKKKQYCIKCNDEFFSVAALLKHLMTHSSRNPGEKLIKCPVCTKRFSTLTTMEIHIHRLHTGEMKHVCQFCDSPFKFSTHLRKHMVTSRCGKGLKKNN